MVLYITKHKERGQNKQTKRKNSTITAGQIQAYNLSLFVPRQKAILFHPQRGAHQHNLWSVAAGCLIQQQRGAENIAQAERPIYQSTVNYACMS